MPASPSALGSTCGWRKEPLAGARPIPREGRVRLHVEIAGPPSESQSINRPLKRRNSIQGDTKTIRSISVIECKSSSGNAILRGVRRGSSPIWLPICNRLRTRPGRIEPEVYFRIVHATQNGHNGAPVAASHEQTVEISLGPKGAFENGNIGALWRRAPPDQVLSAILPGRGNPKPPRVPKTPRVVQFLRKAIEWQALLESGEFTSQGDIATREGITRARVTQVMGMLRLAPEIQEQILYMPDVTRRPLVTERILRPIVTIADHQDQLREFHKILI